MEQGPWEAHSTTASQTKILQFYGYRVHKNPPVPVQSQINPVHVPTLFLENPF